MPGVRIISIIAILARLLPPAVSADDLKVSPSDGDDSHDGRSLPVKTIRRAIRLAEPGDTIHLEPGTYSESADLTNKHGLPGKPITLDGHGALLDGSEAVTRQDWEAISSDLYRRQKLYPTTDDAIVARWFLLWDGKMQRMGRCSKGPSEALKSIADLRAGEWTYLKEEDAFYLRLHPGQDLDTANIRYPARSSGVIQSIAGSWLTVKNITATHVYNDGYNIHGAQRNLVFENITAIECGDDGFSAHEDADCRIDGFTSIGNATGLCDTGTSQTHYRDVFIKDCHGFDLYFIGQTHSIENGIIESSAARTFRVDGNGLADGNHCQVTMKNVLIRRVAETAQELRIGKAGRLHATHCTFLDLNITVTPGGAVDFQNCLVGGERKPDVLLFADTTWQGNDNLYDLNSLRADQTWFKAEAFAEFKKFTGSEKSSKWKTFNKPQSDVGADRTSLKNLIP